MNHETSTASKVNASSDEDDYDSDAESEYLQYDSPITAVGPLMSTCSLDELPRISKWRRAISSDLSRSSGVGPSNAAVSISDNLPQNDHVFQSHEEWLNSLNRTSNRDQSHQPSHFLKSLNKTHADDQRNVTCSHLSTSSGARHFLQAVPIQPSEGTVLVSCQRL